MWKAFKHAVGDAARERDAYVPRFPMLPSIASPIRTRAAASLHRRFLIGAALAGGASVLVVTLAANALLSRSILEQGDARIEDAAGRALIVVDEALAERTRQARVLAMVPDVVSAARAGGQRARELGIGGGDMDRLEKRFSEAHSMGIGGGVRVDILDSADHVLLGSDSSAVGSVLHGMPTGHGDASTVMSVSADGVAERAVSLPANAGRWRIVAHQPDAAIGAAFRTTRLALLAGGVALILILVGLLVVTNRFLERRISGPARDLAEAAEAVAGGDFSVQLRRATADDEIGRLNRAVGAMILELRRLAQTIAGSAHDTRAMSAEITGGSENMSVAAGEIARTASDLSEQATSMAETIASLAGSAGALQALARALDDGAREGVERNGALRALATDNRAGVDASVASLVTLASDVNESAGSIEALAGASAEIGSFVTLVRKLARQSKLLALNAAMEAARAGTHGAGFAVVATEVRRLAAMSSDAAEETEAIVRGVLAGIERSRRSAGRAVAAAVEVRAASARAAASFSEIERAVNDADAWTVTIARTSTATSALVGEITGRLDSLAAGTGTFAAAMQQVAASSEEQSASTQEIAAAATALGAAAEQLSRLVGALKVGELSS